MALIQVNYCSKALFRTVPLNVILPADRFDADTDRYLQEEGQRYKTLYLLHGLLGYYNDWVSFTRIQKWAEEKNLAVVMPSGDNAFYFRSRTPWNDYETFIGKELVDHAELHRSTENDGLIRVIKCKTYADNLQSFPRTNRNHTGSSFI